MVPTKMAGNWQANGSDTMPKDAELWTCYDDFLLKIFWIPIAFLSNLLVSIGFLLVSCRKMRDFSFCLCEFVFDI